MKDQHAQQNMLSGRKATRRQQKHELLITFMANAKTKKYVSSPAPATPKILKTLLSLFA
jgi:hypothetical protein